MPKLLSAPPSYRLHKASGQAVVTLDGKDWYLGPHRSRISVAAYDRLIGEWLANGRRLPSAEKAPTSVEELLAAFWQHAERYYIGLDGKPTSELDSYRQAMKPLRAMYGATNVESFGPLSLRAIRERMIAADCSRKYINQQMGRLKRIFKWGVEHELVSPGIFQALQAVSGLKRGRSAARETGAVKPVSRAQVEAVARLVSRQVWAMIQLQLLTGMRSGEVTAMRKCDMAMTGDVWQYRPPLHKTAYREKERVVFLGPKAQEILGPFLEREPHAYLFSPKDAEVERHGKRREARVTPMQPSQRAPRRRKLPRKMPGDRYTSQTFGRAIANATKRAKVERWSPHRLRHSAATRIRHEFGLEAAQVILGHSRADVTQVYAQSHSRLAAQVMAQCG